MINPDTVKKRGMKRVIKSRQVQDQNGYIVIEDYSSYEELPPIEPSMPSNVKKQGQSMVQSKLFASKAKQELS